MFTYHYSQPADYHFSLDSIAFAEFIAAELTSYPNLSALKLLDLCAGCGVIGMELSYYLPQLQNLHFVEIQEDYLPHFKKNVAIINRPEVSYTLHHMNYEHLTHSEWSNYFDIIVSNPPYFPAHVGTYSPSTFKNRCRFFLDSTFTQFILAMKNALAPKGRAYFLLRNLQQHKIDLFKEVKKNLADSNVHARLIGGVRGTQVVQLIN